MGKTFKDTPKGRPNPDPKGFKRKPKEGRRFESSKGRKPSGNLKDWVEKGRSLEDYFI